MENQERTFHLFNRQYIFFCLINLVVSLSFSMVSTIMSRYVFDIGMSVAAAGTITGAFSIASMVVRPFSGWINDHMGKKKLIALATGFMGLCTLGYGFTQDSAALLALRILHGIAFSLSSTVNMAVIPGIVPEKRIGEAISYYGVIQSIATAAGPSLGLSLANISGYVTNFSVAAFLAAVGVALALSLRFLDEPSHERREHFHFKVEDILAKECLVLAFIDVTISSVNGLENSLIALYGESVGIDNLGWYFTISAATLFFSRLFFGKVADSKGAAYAIYPGLLMMVVGLLMLWRSCAVWTFAVAAIIKSVGVGLARPAIQAACLKSVSANRRGAASSTYYLGSDIGQGTSPAIGGKIVDASKGDYGLAFGVYAIPLVFSCVLYYVSMHRKRKIAHS